MFIIQPALTQLREGEQGGRLILQSPGQGFFQSLKVGALQGQFEGSLSHVFRIVGVGACNLDVAASIESAGAVHDFDGVHSLHPAGIQAGSLC